MAQIKIDGDLLVVEIEGWDKLWALKSRLIIEGSDPRETVARVERALAAR